MAIPLPIPCTIQRNKGRYGQDEKSNDKRTSPVPENAELTYYEKKEDFMNQVNYIKACVTAIASLLASLLGTLYIPVLLLVTCNIIDYITGIWAAGNRADGGISSYQSMRGILKKVTMWLLVVVGAIVDQLLLYASEVIGYELPFTFLVACIVAIWIVCNELISILENMVDIGIELPAFLLPMVKNLKSAADKMGSGKE